MYRTVAYCVDPGCRCEHRAGLVLYRGDSAAEAEDAKAYGPTGYAVEVEIVPPTSAVPY